MKIIMYLKHYNLIKTTDKQIKWREDECQKDSVTL